MVSNELYQVEAKLWDWTSPFGTTSVFAARKSWGDMWGEGAPVALVYARDIEAGEEGLTFTGYAEPLGEHTIEQAEQRYLKMLTEQKAQRKASELAALEPSPDERIAAAMEYGNLLQSPVAVPAKSAARARSAPEEALPDPYVERIGKNYKRGLWNRGMLAVAVEKGVITQAQCEEIINGAESKEASQNA